MNKNTKKALLGLSEKIKANGDSQWYDDNQSFSINGTKVGKVFNIKRQLKNGKVIAEITFIPNLVKVELDVDDNLYLSRDIPKEGFNANITIN